MKDPPLQNNSSNKSATSFPKSSSSDQTLTISTVLSTEVSSSGDTFSIDLNKDNTSNPDAQDHAHERQKQTNNKIESWLPTNPNEVFGNCICSICNNIKTKDRVEKRLHLLGLQAATDGFSPKNYLPEGRFISVFRGEMNGMVTAVKQYKDASNQGEREFNSEVQLISKTRRENLVVLGFCSEGDHRLLVYEYVCNVSLDQYLSNENEHTEHACRPLSWERRMKVALGAAKSLQYLVEGNATRNSRGFSPAPPDYESSSYCDSSESPSESEDTNFSVDTTSIRSMNARFPPTPPTQTFQRHPSSLPSVNDQKINRIRTKKRRSAL